MPCICYGAVSGDEEFDTFLKSEKGQEVMNCLTQARDNIKSHRICEECSLNQIEFRQMFVKCFLHMLVGCDEILKPTLSPIEQAIMFLETLEK